MSTKHTPGPWRIKYGPRHDQDECNITIAGDIYLLADINGPNYAHCEANARLIAAAPEMLEALRESVKAINSIIDDGIQTDFHAWRDDLNALIAKAEA